VIHLETVRSFTLKAYSSFVEPTSKAELIQILGSLRKANFAGGGRSPYKPLLLLWALGQLRTTGKNEFVYEEVEGEISSLIDEFSQSSANKYRAEMPFFYLEKELWVLSGDGELQAKRSRLRASRAVGSFTQSVKSLLLSQPGLIEEVAQFIIDSHFTESYREPLFAAVGLDVAFGTEGSIAIELDQKKRDPKFRGKILKAWKMRCAMCGFDGRLGNSTVGLEAAHIKWHAYGGPDELDNGLALCELHHSLYDLGAIGVSQNLKVIVSESFVAHSESADALVYKLHDKDLFEPAPHAPAPASDNLAWHLTEVFKHPLGV
jgi:putative restriction endonuclease